LREAAANRAVGARSSITAFFSILIDTYLKSGRTDEAAKLLPEALELVEKDGQRYYEALLYALKRELTRIEGSDMEAERNFRIAIRVAQGQSAKSLELNATARLARLLAKQGKRDEARATIAEIYGWFTEGFDTADLKDAKTLLYELAV
jgi:tetratricopeptide (TPR) repeat protein